MRLSATLPVLLLTTQTGLKPSSGFAPLALKASTHQANPKVANHPQFGMTQKQSHQRTLSPSAHQAIACQNTTPHSVETVERTFSQLASNEQAITQIQQSLLENSYAELPLLEGCQSELLNFFHSLGEENIYLGFSNIIEIQDTALKASLTKLFQLVAGKEAPTGVKASVYIRSFINKNPSSREWHADSGDKQLRMIIPLVGESTEYLPPEVSSQYLERQQLVPGLPDSKYVGTVPDNCVKSISKQSALLYTTEYDSGKQGILTQCDPLPHRTPLPTSLDGNGAKRAFFVVDFSY